MAIFRLVYYGAFVKRLINVCHAKKNYLFENGPIPKNRKNIIKKQIALHTDGAWQKLENMIVWVHTYLFIFTTDSCGLFFVLYINLLKSVALILIKVRNSIQSTDYGN